MSLSDIEKAAATTGPMPDELNGAEQLLFQSLRLMYIQHALGRLDIEQARIEKTKLIKEYEVNTLKLRSWEEAHQRIKKLSVVTPELKKSGCELCRKYTDILSGYYSNYREEKKHEQQSDI